jgi:Tol biopolymer transport system component
MPDGRMIFFVRTDWSNGVSSLFLINADGSGLTRLARSDSLSGAAWSPTGRTLAVEHLDPSGTNAELTIEGSSAA